MRSTVPTIYRKSRMFSMRSRSDVTLGLLFLLSSAFRRAVVSGFSAQHQQQESAVSKISFESLKNKRILVVGGSGRVGGSCVTQLAKRGATVTVGGTSREHFLQAQSRWVNQFSATAAPTGGDLSGALLRNVDFVALDREEASSVQATLQQETYDLVVHTAGPFQGKVKGPNGVLQACIKNYVPYIDVCDDYCTASAAKSKYASMTTVPCIISTGCWPGVSSLMAKQLIRQTLHAYPNLKPQDLKVDFSFFTAGSGGAGATLLVATFLILAEKALVIVNGRRRQVNAMESYSRINFGPIVGDRDVAHLNLLETASVADVLGVGNVQALFGTAPDFWNALLGLMAKLPPSLLANEEIMRKLSIFSLPIVRLVDTFAGATNAMRCDVTSPSSQPNLKTTAIYGHENLEPCVGECVTAFCCAILSPGAVKPGVWFPEEAIDGGADAAAVLGLASVGAHTKSVEGILDMTSAEFWPVPMSQLTLLPVP